MFFLRNNMPIQLSVIIPTHNRGSSLKTTLLSLINQTYQKDRYEIIIVDDGGSDGTKNMIEELNKQMNSRIKYLWQKNQGPAAARNLGIKNAKADIISFTDDDCIVHPDWIERIIEAFSKDKDAMIIGGETLPQKGRIVAAVGQGLTKNAFFDYVNGKKETIFFPTCNTAFRKEVFKKAGYFDISFPLAAGEDLEFSWRCFKKGLKLLYKPEIIVTHYCTPNLRAYARQSFNYGRGNYITKLKQPDHPETRGLETGGSWAFFKYCIKELLYVFPFAFIFTPRIKKEEKIRGARNSFVVFISLITHRISYLAGNIFERRAIRRLRHF
jgi:glycosyltransferase involved in cell wall biosynthesis